MRSSTLLSLMGLAGFWLTACGGSSEPARSSNGADETRHDAAHSANESDDKSEKVDRAADQVDKPADKTDKGPE